ncbi:hypothetical protein SBOR_9732 [Sclerotinia borealis F-4128]|uniref:Uncharacterized protein n=1 Tax=Sclerotinia borealis (strain F-4128) TaxID=1432307 RepID=W9C2G9_SCLBF|nr:hypothetical protein SBOR_9732 [Sclerotinia borealis F-4128]
MPPRKQKPDASSSLPTQSKSLFFEAGGNIFTIPSAALAFCRKQPLKQRYQQQTRLNNQLLDLIYAGEIVLEQSLNDITCERLHEAANVSEGQFEIDNRDAIEKVAQDQARRALAVEKVRKHWGGSEAGMSLATTLIQNFGYRFARDLTRIATSTNPERALFLLNGELISRLNAPPRPGKRIERSLMPSEFINVAKVLQQKKEETAWDGTDVAELSLQFNSTGMLGEPSEDYRFDAPPDAVPAVILPPPLKLPPTSVALRNIAKWNSLGVKVSTSADEPDVTCIMDKMVVHRNSIAKPGQKEQDREDDDDEPDVFEAPKACRCGSVKDHENWFSTLKDGYIAKPVGWMTMIELVTLRPEHLCVYHVRQLANALALETYHVKEEELLERMDILAKEKNKIDELRVDNQHYSWFRPHEAGKNARRSKTLGLLKYTPPLLFPMIVTLDVKSASDITRRGYVTGPLLNGHDIAYLGLNEVNSRLYRHHGRQIGTGSGFVYHSYFSILQQAARQDLFLWRKVCRQRLDGEFRLVTIPVPMMEVRSTETCSRIFTHGDVHQIFGEKKKVALENCLTAYVINTIEENQAPAHELSAFLPRGKIPWSTVSHTVFDGSKAFTEGQWHDLTEKFGFKAFKEAKRRHKFRWEPISDNWAIVAPGVPLRISPVDPDPGQGTFSATPIPYAAVTFDEEGNLGTKLENGMLYSEVCNSHTTVTPIFDDKITQHGLYECPRFPVEIRCPGYGLIEQALLGQIQWDEPLVLDQARAILNMEDDKFDTFYAENERKAQTWIFKTRRLIEERDRLYGDRSYFALVDPNQAVQTQENSDEEFEIPVTPLQKDKGKGKAVGSSPEASIPDSPDDPLSSESELSSPPSDTDEPGPATKKRKKNPRSNNPHDIPSCTGVIPHLLVSSRLNFQERSI